MPRSKASKRSPSTTLKSYLSRRKATSRIYGTKALEWQRELIRLSSTMMYIAQQLGLNLSLTVSEKER